MLRDEKKDLRRKMCALQKDFLKNLSSEEKTILTEQSTKKILNLPEYEKAKTIFAYVPSELEADSLPIIFDAIQKGKKVALPKVNSKAMKEGKSEMDFYFLEKDIPLDEQLKIGSYGIREPKESLEKAEISNFLENSQKKGDEEKSFDKIFILVPGVAFTRDGKRLGHGKGFYDIYIEKLKKVCENIFLCGFCLPCQIVENLPNDENDALMNIVIA